MECVTCTRVSETIGISYRYRSDPISLWSILVEIQSLRRVTTTGDSRRVARMDEWNLKLENMKMKLKAILASLIATSMSFTAYAGTYGGNVVDLTSPMKLQSNFDPSVVPASYPHSGISPCACCDLSQPMQFSGCDDSSSVSNNNCDSLSSCDGIGSNLTSLFGHPSKCDCV